MLNDDDDLQRLVDYLSDDGEEDEDDSLRIGRPGKAAGPYPELLSPGLLNSRPTYGVISKVGLKYKMPEDGMLYECITSSYTIVGNIVHLSERSDFLERPLVNACNRTHANT